MIDLNTKSMHFTYTYIIINCVHISMFDWQY